MAQSEPNSSLPFRSVGDHRPRFAWQPYSRRMKLMPNFFISCIGFFWHFIPSLPQFFVSPSVIVCTNAVVFNPRLDHAFLPPYRIVHTLPQLVVEGSVNVLPPSLIATILSSRNRNDIILPCSPSLVLLLIRTVTLRRMNAQG